MLTFQGRPTPDLVGQFSGLLNNAYQTQVTTPIYKTASLMLVRSFRRETCPRLPPTSRLGGTMTIFRAVLAVVADPVTFIRLRLAVVADQVAITILAVRAT